jgi:hypothetical protein
MFILIYQTSQLINEGWFDWICFTHKWLMNLSRETYELSVKLNNLTSKRNISWTQFDLIAFGLYYFVLVRENDSSCRLKICSWPITYLLKCVEPKWTASNPSSSSTNSMSHFKMWWSELRWMWRLDWMMVVWLVCLDEGVLFRHFKQLFYNIWTHGLIWNVRWIWWSIVFERQWSFRLHAAKLDNPNFLSWVSNSNANSLKIDIENGWLHMNWRIQLVAFSQSHAYCV